MATNSNFYVQGADGTMTVYPYATVSSSASTSSPSWSSTWSASSTNEYVNPNVDIPKKLNKLDQAIADAVKELRG